MVQNELSIRFTKARRAVNKNFEMTMTTKSIEATTQEYFCILAHNGDKTLESVLLVTEEFCDLCLSPLEQSGPGFDAVSTSKSPKERYGLRVSVKKDHCGLIHRTRAHQPEWVLARCTYFPMSKTRWRE